MEWNMGSVLNSADELAAAEHPALRLFNVPGHRKGPAPLDDTPGSWTPCG